MPLESYQRPTRMPFVLLAAFVTAVVVVAFVVFGRWL
jgi:hypothetical protein